MNDIRTHTDQILHTKAVRITPMRQLLLDYILTQNQAVGLNELEAEFPKADRITIYRTLKTFEEKGILHSIEQGHSEVQYALCHEECGPEHHVDRHPHFACERCGRIICLEEVFIPRVAIPQGFIQHDVEITIKGVCGECV